jgi:hypothetical protein
VKDSTISWGRVIKWWLYHETNQEMIRRRSNRVTKGGNTWGSKDEGLVDKRIL